MLTTPRTQGSVKSLAILGAKRLRTFVSNAWLHAKGIIQAPSRGLRGGQSTVAAIVIFPKHRENLIGSTAPDDFAVANRCIRPGRGCGSASGSARGGRRAGAGWTGGRRRESSTIASGPARRAACGRRTRLVTCVCGRFRHLGERERRHLPVAGQPAGDGQ